MGVYHLMGLGRSPGAVTAAISYLADRYERWHPVDTAFFVTSGEFAQEGKRGDIQALLLFTTPEVMKGREDALCSDYIDNRAGQTRGKGQRGEAMIKVLKRVLPDELKRAAGGRNEVALYWCEIDQADSQATFERVARVMHATKPPGDVGKEMWINLTGGNNVVNLALQLAAALLGNPARLYYLLSEETKCLRHTTPVRDLGTERDRFWVDIPVIYLRLDAATRAILEVLEEAGPVMKDTELWSRLKTHPTFGSEFQTVELEDLRRGYLRPMAGQQLTRRVDKPTGGRPEEPILVTGQQWPILKHYYTIVADLLRPDSDAEKTLTDLATKQAWFHAEVLTLS
jgi:hypothetical protein